ncbi:MAG: response regulator [Minisyncoccia bacterium]|jgi:CheY-like chemotaxis protein
MPDEKPKILIIDDDNDFREIFKAKLEASGFEVAAAADGQTGMDKARIYRPHVILLDVKMPGMSGIETLVRMKADPELKDMTVIFLTSFGEADEDASWVDNKFAKEIGAVAHIRKSDDLDKIVKQIMDTIYPKV